MKITTGNLFLALFYIKNELHVGETWKNVIRKSDFFCKIYRHVRHSLILICTLMSSMGENDQHFEKMILKNTISSIGNHDQFYMLVYYGGNKKNFFKISKILPTSKPFLKIEIHIEITYRWNREFFTKNDQISLDSIVEKSKFYSGVQFDFFFSKQEDYQWEKTKIIVIVV